MLIQGLKFNLLSNSWLTCWIGKSTCWSTVDQQVEFQALNQHVDQLLINIEVPNLYRWLKLINSWSTCWISLRINKLINYWSTSGGEINKLINYWSTFGRKSTCWSTVDQLRDTMEPYFFRQINIVDQQLINFCGMFSWQINMLINSWSTCCSWINMLINSWSTSAWKIQQVDQLGVGFRGFENSTSWSTVDQHSEAEGVSNLDSICFHDFSRSFHDSFHGSCHGSFHGSFHNSFHDSFSRHFVSTVSMAVSRHCANTRYACLNVGVYICVVKHEFNHCENLQDCILIMILFSRSLSASNPQLTHLDPPPPKKKQKKERKKDP